MTMRLLTSDSIDIGAGGILRGLQQPSRPRRHSARPATLLACPTRAGTMPPSRSGTSGVEGRNPSMSADICKYLATTRDQRRAPTFAVCARLSAHVVCTVDRHPFDAAVDVVWSALAQWLAREASRHRRFVAVSPESGGREAAADDSAAVGAGWVERDRAFIERVLAPEWSVTQADGTIRSRAAVLHDAFIVRTVTVESMIVDDVTVTLLGDTAIVRGRTQATGVVGDQRGSARLRFTDTFIKRRGQWQAVASHAPT